MQLDIETERLQFADEHVERFGQAWLEDVRKVKPEDIQRVAKTYLKNFHFAALGNPSYFDKALFQSR